MNLDTVAFSPAPLLSSPKPEKPTLHIVYSPQPVASTTLTQICVRWIHYGVYEQSMWIQANFPCGQTEAVRVNSPCQCHSLRIHRSHMAKLRPSYPAFVPQKLFDCSFSSASFDCILFQIWSRQSSNSSTVTWNSQDVINKNEGNTCQARC